MLMALRVWWHDRRRGHQVIALDHALAHGIVRTEYRCHGCDWTWTR